MDLLLTPESLDDPKYGPVLDQYNTSITQQRLGKLLRRKGADPILLEMFYFVVVQVVLLFGVETWVLKSLM